MKKNFLILLLLTFSLYAYNYSLKEGWQMVGVMEKIDDMSNFDSSCVQEVWRYDNENLIWKNYNPTDKNSSTLNFLDEAMGFWIKAGGNCQINPPNTLSFSKLYDGDKFIIGDSNQSKRFEIITDSNKFSELYSTYVDSSYIPNMNGAILFLRNSSKEYTSDIRVTEIKSYLAYNEIFLETIITKGNCKKIEDNISAPFEFVSIPISQKIIFNESVKVEYCYDGYIQESDINETFEELSFREVNLMSNPLIPGIDINKRVEVVQNSEVYSYLYYNHIRNSGPEEDELPPIDFETETLLALFTGKYFTTGYGSKVTKVKEYSDYIEVEIKNFFVGYFCPAGEAITSPVTFVTIPKTDKEIIFKEYTNVTNCRDF